MTPTHFSHLANNNVPKNKLQREALRLLQASSNRLIVDKTLFLQALKNEVEKLNEAHPNCTPLEFSTYGFAREGVTLGAHFTVAFRLYPVSYEGSENLDRNIEIGRAA